MDTHQKNISDTEFKFENTRNLQKLKDIIGKEIAYHDLESHCEDEERGFLMNQIHEMMNVFMFIHCSLKSTFSINNMSKLYMYQESTLTVKLELQKNNHFRVSTQTRHETS